MIIILDFSIIDLSRFKKSLGLVLITLFEYGTIKFSMYSSSKLF